MRVVTAPDFATLRDALSREIAALRARDPLAPLRVVAPGERARGELRRALARAAGGLFAVDVTSLPRRVDDLTLGAVRRRGGALLSEAGFDLLVARVLSDRAASGDAGADPLLRMAGTPGVAAAVAGTLRDFVEGGFGPDDLTAEDAGGNALAASLFRIHRAFRDAMEHESLWDRRRREMLAAERLASGAEPDPPATFLFGFHDVTPLQFRLLRAAAARGPVTAFVPGPGATTSEPGEGAAAPFLLRLRDAGAEITALDRAAAPTAGIADALFEQPELIDPGEDALRLATFPTEAAEVRGLARRILLTRAGGLPFDAMLVTVPPGGPSPLLFRRVFARAGIPLADGASVPRRLTGDGRRALALARAAWGGDPADRDALSFLPDEARDGAAFDDALRSARERGAAAAHAGRLRALYEARFGEPLPAAIDALLGAIAIVYGDRDLAAGDALAAFTTALARDRDRHVGDAAGAVRLVAASAARFLSAPLVFHAGRTAGSVLRPPASDPLLPDAVRARILERHEHAGRSLPLREARTEEQLLLARFALEASTERTVLTWSRRERTGGELRHPDGLLLDLASRRAGDALEPDDPRFDAQAPGDDPAVARAHPVDATDLDLALFGGGRAREDDLARLLEEPRGRHVPHAMRAAELRWRHGALTAHDGALSDERAIRRVRALLAERAWSPTALETLANCPFAYLLRLLRLDRDETEGDDYSAMERGQLFHAWIERIHGQLLATERLPLDPDGVDDAIAILDRVVAAEEARLARLPRRKRLPRRATLHSLRDDVAILLSREAHLPPAERGTPIRIEMAFGPPDEDAWDGDGPPPAPPAIPLPDGGRLPLRGKIDRVDRLPDGRLEVIDYKTGQARVRNGKIRHREDGRTELHLQLPLYLQAARAALGTAPARAAYWFAQTNHDFERVVFTDADLQARLPEISEIAAHLLGRARDGWFPCRPGKTCCRGELAPACGPGVAQRFLRKTDDPAMRAHLALVRGEGDDA